ncbi:cadherin-4-like [Xenentodon cancila]
MGTIWLAVWMVLIATVQVKRQVELHEGHRDFFIHFWDSHGRSITVPVRVVYNGHRHGNRISQNINKELRSTSDKAASRIYSISGPGADQPPVGLFTMDKNTGKLYVTQPLDRETQSRYTFIANAVADGENPEEPLEIVIFVIDQNDNNPVFNVSTFNGEVAEASPKGFEVIQVVATDADDPTTDNGVIRYSIVNQEPKEPSDSLFSINPVTGVITVDADGLDRKKYPQYTLDVKAADMEGRGLSGNANVILKVTDSNDNAPIYTQSLYEVTVAENQVDVVVVTMSVTDADEPDCLASNAKFTIIDGDPEGLFSVKTGTNKKEGIITTAKGLDFEKNSKHTLLVSVQNEVPFSTPLPTAIATVVVTVEDANEPPVIDPQ